MELSGKIIAVLPIATGSGKNGVWKNQDFVLETGDQYPKKVCFNLWGDNIEKFPIDIDDDVTINFDVESREYNGRYYTTVKAWKVEKTVGPSTQGGAEKTMANRPVSEADDLPF